MKNGQNQIQSVLQMLAWLSVGDFDKAISSIRDFLKSLLLKVIILQFLKCIQLYLALNYGRNFKGKKKYRFYDNLAVCQEINSGKAQREIVQDGLREIAFVTAIYEFQVRMVHLSSKEKRICESLSR